MTVSYIIENFKPVDLKELDCYRSAVAPILKYYNVDYKLLFLQRDLYLKYDEKLDCEQYDIFSLSDFFDDVGVLRSYVTDESQDIISTIKSSIDHNRPIIAFFDSYYDDTFPAVYNKTHSRHACPIYGYDDENFFVIGNDYVGDFKRIAKTMSIKTVHNCIEGYKKLYNNVPCIQIFSRYTVNDENYRDKYSNKYINFYCYHNADIMKHLLSLREYVNFFENNCFDEKIALKHSCQSLIMFNDLVKIRISEYYGISRVFPNTYGLLKIDESIVEKGNYIRAVFYHAFNTKEIRKEMLEKSLNYIRDIIDLEIKRYNLLENFRSFVERR